MIYFRSYLFQLIHALTAILFSTITLLMWPLPLSWRYGFASQWAKSNIWLLKVICDIHLKVEGAENIDRNQAAIIFSKHQSAWETLALQAVFPPQVWVLKRELLWIPFFGWALASLKSIAIDRSAGRKALSQIIEQGKQRLSAGTWVVIFPEGTRLASGYIGKFGIGGARLAVDTGYPLVPVAHNAGKCWPRNSILKYPGTITMVVGKSIAVQDRDPVELNQQLFIWMTEKMTELEGKAPKLQERNLKK